jgi:hypothetical protein
MPGSSHDSQNQTDKSGQDRAIGSNLLTWASWVMARSGQSPAPHHRLLLKQLDLMSRGELDRLMVLMPPGSAKSTYASVNTDLWGAYVPTPAPVGTWYAWVEGTDGSTPTVYPTPFTVT